MLMPLKGICLDVRGESFLTCEKIQLIVFATLDTLNPRGASAIPWLSHELRVDLVSSSSVGLDELNYKRVLRSEVLREFSQIVLWRT